MPIPRIICLLCCTAILSTALIPDDRSDLVDQLFQKWDLPDSPGAAVGVIHHGDLIYSKGYGLANLDHGIPLDDHSVFYMASESKQFTAACIALLAQEGELSLNDDIRMYLPELPQYPHAVTIRHLIHHTSGIKDYLALMAIGGKNFGDVFTEHQVMDLIASQPKLNNVPGDKYVYSNSGYFLLSQIISKITGKSLREFAQERIFGPLEMTQSVFHDDYRMIIPGRVTGYDRDGDGFVLNAMQNFDNVGSGGLRSCVVDIAKWDQNFYTGKVGGKKLIETIRTRGKLNDGTQLPYAFGLLIDRYKGLSVNRHGGAMNGFRTHVLRFPEQEFTVICLANISELEPASLTEQVAELYLQDELSESVESFVGRYTNQSLAATYTVKADGVELSTDSGDGIFTPLKSQREETFAAGGLTMQFHRDANDKIDRMTIDADQTGEIEFLRGQE